MTATLIVTCDCCQAITCDAPTNGPRRIDAGTQRAPTPGAQERTRAPRTGGIGVSARASRIKSAGIEKRRDALGVEIERICERIDAAAEAMTARGADGSARRSN
jgi:hypothetical protein